MATEKNITMKQFNGTDYDTLYPKTLSSQVEGLSDNFFTKAQTLTSDIASLFVGGNISVPNDAFRYLGKYAEYWWSAYSDESWDEYVISQTNITEDVLLGQNPTNINIAIAKSISLNNVTGVISLVDTETYNFIVNDQISNNQKVANYITSKAPCYIKLPDSDLIYYIPNESTTTSLASASATIKFGAGGSYNGGYVVLNGSGSPKSQIITSSLIHHTAGQYNYLQSTNRNAYPDSGTVGNITYNFLGIPFEKLPTGARIQTGSYVGTGTHGADNPCSLTFDTLPKMLMIPLKDPSNDSNGLQFNSTGYQSPKRPLFLFDTIKSYDSYTRADAFGHQVFIKIDGTNFSWYSLGNNTYQSNEINATYYWVAFY